MTPRRAALRERHDTGKRLRRWRVASLAALLLASACDDDVAQDTAPMSDAELEAAIGPAPDRTSAPLSTAVYENARTHATKAMRPTTELTRGTLDAGGTHDAPLVLIGTQCYVVVAAAEDSVGELDLVLFDPQGAPALRDADRGSRAVLGARHPICPMVPGTYRLQVRAQEGAGAFAFRVYQAPSI